MSAPEPGRVTTLELFFDLVFVFTITELTSVLFRDANATGLLQVVLMLTVIWWMYGGYAWMTNAVRADTAARRLLLLGGMGGFFVLSLSIPHAFSGSGLAFGLAYLLVVLVHSILFTRAAAVSAARAILALAPWNVASALLVVAGGALGGTTQYVLWAAAGLLEWLTPAIRGTSGFVIGASHFVERHGLVVIIAIGESIVAIGVGTSHLPVDAPLVLVAALGLALSACLWWIYFGGHDARAEEALRALPVRERAFAAVWGFGAWHVPLLLGVVAAASAEREATEHAFSALTWWRATLLGGGVAVFCLGNAGFRRTLRLGGAPALVAVAVLAVATIPLGALVAPALQAAALVALLVALFVAPRARRAAHARRPHDESAPPSTPRRARRR
jgi:low temperature requirement protein LtrA